MSRRKNGRSHADAPPGAKEPAAPAGTAPRQETIDYRQLEELCQTEALITAATHYVTVLTHGDELQRPARVERPDGSVVALTTDALDIAMNRLQALRDQVVVEIDRVFPMPPGHTRKRYRTLAPRSREEPEREYYAAPRAPRDPTQDRAPAT